MGYHYFWAMLWDQNVSESHIELYYKSQKEKRVVVGLNINQILMVNFWFNNLCSIIMYMFAQGYLSY